MCGVAAVVGAPGAEATVQRLLGAMAHRGPDGSGQLGVAEGALGVCRLRVRRPARMTLPPRDGATVAAFNGEVYGDLPCAGAVPQDVDGELALLLGTRFEQVDGMWALIAYHSGRFVLSRDRWGLRPLYYRSLPQGWAVASEIPALLAAHGPAGISREAIVETLAFGVPLSADTVFDEIRAVPRGAAVELTPGGCTIQPWAEEPRWGEEAPHTGPKPGAHLVDALTDSVVRNLVSERQVGLAFSGGVDSTLLAGLLLRMRRRDLITVSVQTEGVDGDGVSQTAEVLGPGPAELGWRHVTTAVGKYRYLELLDSAVAAMGYPTRMSSVPLYAALADAAAKAGVVVLITGEGADELFLGYDSYRRFVADPRIPAVDRLDDLHFPPERRAHLTRLAGAASVDRCRELYRETAHAALAKTFGPLRTLELRLSLQPLLERADLCLMREGVEGRTPFLHGDVPAVAAVLGEHELIQASGGKQPLRELAARMPRPARPARPVGKHPFRAPLRGWLRQRDELWAGMVRQRVRSACARTGLATEAVDGLLADARDSDEAAGLVGGLLAVDAWWASMPARPEPGEDRR